MNDAEERRRHRLERLAILGKMLESNVSPSPADTAHTRTSPPPPPSLEEALREHAERKIQIQNLAAEMAPEMEKRRALQATLDSLPQHERRRVLDAIGMRHVSAAPAPITPLRCSGTNSQSIPQSLPATPEVLSLDHIAQRNPEGSSSPEPAPKSNDAGAWPLRAPQRYQGYRLPLYALLKAAHSSGGARPSAREVLDSFKKNQPPEVIEVMHDGIKYYDRNGNSKPADIRAIEKAIDRLVQHGPDSAE